MRVGIIGVGVIGSRHLSSLAAQEGVVIAAFCGNNEQKLSAQAEPYGAAIYTDYKQMFAEAELDAVFICTPPGLRVQPIAEAAARGIACFIEKPPAKTMEEAHAITKAIAESGIINSVGFMYRYTGAVNKAKELIEASGSPVPIVRSILVCGAALPEATTPRWFFNKALSGGPLFDQAIHLLDSTRYIVSAGSGDVQRIHAFGSNIHAPKTADFTVEEHHVINLAYAGGTIQTHTHSWAITDYQCKIELLSHDYQLLIDLTNQESTLAGSYKGETISLRYDGEDMYMEEVRVFLEAVRTNDQSLIRSPYSDAAKTLSLVLAGNESVDAQQALTL